MQLGESQHSFSVLTEHKVDLFELLSDLLVDRLVSSLNEKITAECPQLFRRALNVHAVVGVIGFPIDDAERELVG